MFAITTAALVFVAQAATTAEGHTLTVEARDLITDAAVPDVSVTLRLPDGVKMKGVTGADGVARFEYSLSDAKGRRFFSLTAGRESLVPLFARWLGSADSPEPPDRLLLQTEKATAIGGRVLDEEGRPLPDAVVVVSVKKGYPRSRQSVAVSGESARTDAEGRWSLKGVPERPESVGIAAYHYLCLDENSSYHQKPFEPLDALRDGSAVLRLRRGTRVEGTVLSPDGQPVAGAEVSYGEGRGYGNAIPPIKSDGEGRFTFGIKPGTIMNLVAQAPGFGPVLQPVKVGDGPTRVYLTLPKGHSVRGRVVDPAGNPIARASVSLYWSGDGKSAGSYFGSAAGRRLETDGEGRFEWKDAPAAGVHADIGSDGFANKSAIEVASDRDQEIVLVSSTPVEGTVVDRDTGEPIGGFSLTLAAAWKPGDPFIWQRGTDLDKKTQRTAGSFRTTFSSPAHRYLIRAQADGYFAEDSEPFAPEGKSVTLAYRLTRGEPIRGTVRNP